MFKTLRHLKKDGSDFYYDGETGMLRSRDEDAKVRFCATPVSFRKGVLINKGTVDSPELYEVVGIRRDESGRKRLVVKRAKRAQAEKALEQKKKCRELGFA